MKNTSKHLLWVIPLVMVIAVFIVYTARGNINLSDDEAPFNTIELPPESVSAVAPIGSDSVWVTVVSRGGIPLTFEFPRGANATASNFRTVLYHSSGDVESAVVELNDPERARNIILMLLDRYRARGDLMTYYSYLDLAEEEPMRITRVVDEVIHRIK